MSPLVPESVRLKEKRDAILQAEQVAKALQLRDERENHRHEIIKRAEQYVREYREMEQEEQRQKRNARNNGCFLTESGQKLLLVIRVRGTNNVPPKPKKILELFRLLQINNAVFIRVNTATERMLELIVPYITYGYPSLTTIRNLVYKRGYAKVNNQRVAISTNDIIRDNLQQFHVICVEDLIHEIYTVGEHFKEVNRFLWPFKLNPPTGGYASIKTQFNEGGDLGNREVYINSLVEKML